MRTLAGLLPLLAGGMLLVAPASAQDPARPWRTERVTYANPADGMPLSAALTLPAGRGPFPGVVVLSVAGADDLIDHLAELGYAVLWPERRGMVAIEQLLAATFQDLADDGAAALAYLRARPEVDSTATGLLGQGEDAPAALLAAVGEARPAFLVLLSMTGLSGSETFRIEQRRIAEERRYSAAALEALDRYSDQLSGIVLSEMPQGLRAARLRAFLESSNAGLPRSAAFPRDVEGQVQFFTSPWWGDRLSFRPERALTRVASPLLVVQGLEDTTTPWDRHLPAVRTALVAAPTDDVLACLLPGRVRHAFPPELVALVGDWLLRRYPSPDAASVVRPAADPQEACMEDPPR